MPYLPDEDWLVASVAHDIARWRSILASPSATNEERAIASARLQMYDDILSSFGTKPALSPIEESTDNGTQQD